MRFGAVSRTVPAILRGLAPIGYEGFVLADRGIRHMRPRTSEYGAGAIKNCIIFHYVQIRNIKRDHP